MRSVVFLLLGAALLVGLFVVLQPEGTAPLPSPAAERDPPDGVAAPTAASTGSADAADAAAAAAPPESAVPPPASGEPASRTFDLQIKSGRVISGATTITVAQGDLVVLRLLSDRADELHVHGYDVAVKLGANQPGSLAFQADRSGRFDIELHHGGEEIAAIEVQPR